MFNLIDSLILTETQKIQLRELIGFQNNEFTLLYRASRDGFAATIYHKLVDFRKRTLSIIKTSSGWVKLFMICFLF